jgi:hypothetical protein
MLNRSAILNMASLRPFLRGRSFARLLSKRCARTEVLKFHTLRWAGKRSSVRRADGMLSSKRTLKGGKHGKHCAIVFGRFGRGLLLTGQTGPSRCVS